MALELELPSICLMTSAGFGKIAQYPVIEYAESDRFALLQCYKLEGLQMRWIAIAVIRFCHTWPKLLPKLQQTGVYQPPALERTSRIPSPAQLSAMRRLLSSIFNW